MKKIFTLVAAVAVFALVSCGGGHGDAAATDSTAVTADTTAVVEAAPVDTAAADSAAHH